MSSGMDSTVAQTVIAGMCGQAAFTGFGAGGTTTKAKLRLISSGSNETTAGTQISGGSYPAGGIEFTLASTWGSPSYSAPNAQVTNSAGAVSQTGMPAATTAQAEIWDEAGTPKRWWWGDLSANVTTNSGDTLTFATSSITVQIAV